MSAKASERESYVPEAVVLAYHERTKHYFHRFAASLGYMDWATQPDPFRRYAGADLVRLPLPKAGHPLPYWQLYAIGTVPPEPLSLESVSLFFRYALSLTAWKRFDETTWSLRANPSSGNLHPTEGYGVLPAIERLGDTPAVYHYAPRAHALERRAVLDAKRWTELVAPFPEGSFLVGLSSVHWREAWKYGERAFRYCQHDVGHALATLRIAAAALGWRLVLLAGVSDGAISSLLGLTRDQDFGEAEREEPELVALIAPLLSSAIPWRPRIHLGLFVHRVAGLSPGLYALPRDPDKVEILKGVMRPEFRWQRVPTCPPGLPLYLLQEGDCRALAATVSCGQDIAGEGAFSLGMIADYRDSLTRYGAAFYRNLFWEAGMVGQVLYLEAEEAGIRSTGIGCYFDDPVQEVFGIASRRWQSFYHFTVGGPVEDVRLTTLPAYG
jgi:SagB-type dehydrogenase family enzyme